MKFELTFALAMAINAMCPQQDLPSTGAVEVELDRSVWPMRVSWPSANESVLFVYAPARLSGVCRELSADRLSRIYKNGVSRSLRIGEVCERLVVIFRDDDFTPAAGRSGLEFVARHEAFHLAAQLYGSAVPLEYLRMERRSPTIQALAFYRSLIPASSTTPGVAASKERICTILRNRYLSLDEDERRAIDGLATWEWPAEYYAFSSMAQTDELDESAYKEIRRLLGSSDEYAAGIAVGRFLDAAFTNHVWKQRVNSGESMLDILGSWCSTEYEPLPRTNVRVGKFDLPLD